MMELRLIETAAMLGFYVLFAGLFAVAYTIGRLRRNGARIGGAVGLYVLHASVAAAVIGLSPLEIGWKALLLASSLAVLAIPNVTLRFLHHTHSPGIHP